MNEVVDNFRQFSLIKRFLLYVLVFFISLTILVLCGGFLREYETETYYYKVIFVVVCLIPQYIFGMIFLKTKFIVKLIVPFLATIISFGSIFIVQTKFSYILYDNIFLGLMIFFIPIAIVWEIAYQILKLITKLSQS